MAFGARFDYLTPARVKVLVVPVGNIPDDVFSRHLQSIRAVTDIRLLDLSPLPQCRYFNPQEFTQGRIFYEYSDSPPPDDTAFLNDFEPFRKTFVVLGVALGSEPGHAELAALREQYPTAIVHNIVCFQSSDAQDNPDIWPVSPEAEKIITSVETVLCGVSANFLRALDAYASSFENITLRSPVSFTNSTVLTRTITQAQKRLSSGSSLKVSFANGQPAPPAEPKGKFSQRQSGRQTKLMGNFFLLAGRSNAAVQYFADAAINLKKAEDHLWLASALDGLAVASSVLSFLDLPHTVSNPMLASVLQLPKPKTVAATKPSSESGASRRTSANSPRASLSSNYSVGARSSSHASDLTQLPIVEWLLLLHSRFSYYYHSSTSDDEDCVPDVVYVESLLRNISLMVVMYMSGNASPKRIITSVVTAEPVAKSPSHENSYISRGEIMSEIDKIFELQLIQLEFSEQCRIYCCLSSIYADLGYYRKQGFILRILLIALTPKASQIEENGSLAGVCSKESIRSIFQLLFSIYGIDTETEASHKKAQNHYADWINIQLSLLKICLRIAEALRDYLTLAKLCVLTFSRFAHCLAAEDQLKVKEKLVWLRRLLATENKDFKIPHPDPFLVRNATFVVSSNNSNLHLYVPPETSASSGSKQEQTFFDPYKKKVATNTNMDSVICVNETYQLKLVVQNPYLFDLELHSIELVEDGGKKIDTDTSSLFIVSSTPFATNSDSSFGNGVKNVSRLRKTPISSAGEGSSESSLPPHSLSEVLVTFKPKEAGNLTISSFKINVGNADSQLFYIVGQEKSGELQKLKTLPSTNENSECGLNELIKNLSCNEIGDRIHKKSVSLKAVQRQPKLSVTKNSVSNGWMMLLEGESQRHSLELRNMSQEMVNYMSFSLWDSTIDATTAILNSNSSTVAEEDTFELEWQLIKKKALTIVNKSEIASKYKVIEPGSEMKIDYQVYGKRAMTDSKMILEYGNKGREDGEHFVKNLVVPLNFTVNRSLEVIGVEVLPFFSSSLQGFSLSSDDSQDKNMHDLLEFIANTKSSLNEDVADYCLLLLDVKNMWRDDLSAKISNKIKPDLTYVVEDRISSGSTKRLLIPVKRIKQDPAEVSKPIPSLRNKQFIKNYSQSDAEVSQSRLSYWTRCELLENLSGEWYTRGVTNKRSGEIDLRKIRLTPAMTSSLTYDRISIQHEIILDEGEEGAVEKTNNKFLLSREKFYVMKTRITNHTAEAITGTIRHIPQPLNAVTKQDLAIDQKILYNGVLQTHLGENAIEAGGTFEMDTPFLILQKGQYEWGCMFDVSRDRMQRVVGREPVYITAL